MAANKKYSLTILEVYHDDLTIFAVRFLKFEVLGGFSSINKLLYIIK